MVQLPTVRQDGPVTVTAPQSRVSARDIEGLGNAQADAIKSTQQAVEAVGEPIVKQQAFDDAQKMITRDADGNIQLQPTPTPFIAGHLGEVYKKTANDVFRAQMTDGLHSQMQQLAAKAMLPVDQGGGGGDPEWFRMQADQYVKALAAKGRDGQQFDILDAGTNVVGQYYRNLVGQRSAADANMSKQTFSAHIDQLQTDLNDLAMQGGSDTPLFKQKAAELDAYRKQMLQDPRLQYSQAQYEADSRDDHTRLMVNGAVGVGRRFYEQTGNLAEAQRRTEKALEDIPMDPGKRLQILGEISKHMTASDAVKGAARAQIVEAAGGMEKAIYDSHKADDVAINDMIAKLTAAKAYSAAARLDAARKFVQLEPVLTGQSAGDAVGALNKIIDQAKNPQPIPGAGVVSAAPPVVSGAGFVDADALRTYVGQRAQEMGFVGFVPKDGEKYGIKTGSKEEWANFFVGLAKHESGLNVRTVGDADQFVGGSRGLFQLSYQDAAAHGLNGGQAFTADQLADPKTNTDAALTIAKRLMDQNGGSIQAGLGKYWGPISREGWTPGKGRDAGLPWQAWSNSPIPDSNVNRATLAEMATRELVAHTQGVFNTRTTQLWDGMKKAFDQGFAPTPQELDDLKVLMPGVSDEKLRKEIADRLQAEGASRAVAALPVEAQQNLVQAQRAAASQGKLDYHERQALATVTKAVQDRTEMLEKDPVTYGQRNIPSTVMPGAAALPPLDTSSPQAFAGAIAARQRLLGTVKQLEPTAAPQPFTSLDRVQLADGLKAASGQQAGMVLDTLTGALKPDQMGELLRDDGVKNAVLGLTKSGDPTKMTAGFKFLDAMNRSNPLKFEQTFGHQAVLDMHQWQTLTQFQPGDQAAREMMTANDPATMKAREIRQGEADLVLKGVTADAVRDKLAAAGASFLGSLPGVFMLTKPDQAVSDTAAMSPDALLADYREEFRSGFSILGDQKRAEKFAIEQIGKKWGVSTANGGRLMAYPPENYVPKIDGSHDWTKAQLDADIASHLGSIGVMSKGSEFAPATMTPRNDDEARALRIYEAPKALVADQQTQADIAAGRAPSYRVIYQEPETGNFRVVTDKPGSPIAMRWSPDASLAQSDARENAMRARAGVSERRARADAAVRAVGEQLSAPTPGTGGGF